MISNRLLVVDDEPNICALIRDVAEPMGFEVSAASNMEEFSAAYDDVEPTAAVVDLNIGDSDGVQILRFLAEKKSNTRIVLVSGADIKILDASQRIGERDNLKMVGVLQKPVLVPDLEAMLFKCMRRPNERELTVADLSGAIDEGQLTVHYQPIVRVLPRQEPGLIASEALVRWQHPERGLLLPDVFIHLADDDRIMANLTDVVLLTAVQQLRNWEDAGIKMRLTVNLTVNVIADTDFPDRLLRLLQQFDIEPARLVLDLTERGSLVDVLERLDILTRLRLKGIGLAIDDFGTGNSSLVQLHRLPFNELKIDRSFTQEIVNSRKAAVLVKSIIDLGHNLDMTVCAEGVSEAAILRMLVDLDCDFAQGFLFSKAMPASTVAENLGSWNIRQYLR